MDSIEKMRRLNELTKELKQRGFAESSFEAIQQANQIYGNDDLTDEVKHGLIQNSAHEKMSRESEATMENSATVEKKLSKLTESVDLLTNKINEIVKAINDIDSRLTALKNTRPAERVVERVVERPVERKAEQPVEAAKPAEHASEEQHAEAPKDEYSMNQRTGNYKPNDVAIDKMFYYGKK